MYGGRPFKLVIQTSLSNRINYFQAAVFFCEWRVISFSWRSFVDLRPADWKQRPDSDSIFPSSMTFSMYDSRPQYEVILLYVTF